MAESLEFVVTALAVLVYFAWAVPRLVRSYAKTRRAPVSLRIRLLIAVVVWVAVSAVTFYFGLENYFVLGEGASVVAFIRAHPNWQLGGTLILVGVPFAISGLINVLFWPAHHRLEDVLLLGPYVGAIYGGPLATGYALFLCGAVSVVWGLAVGFPSKTPSRNGAPFTVESVAPEHVIRK